MQVVLRIVSGPHSGRRVWLMPNQRVKVGASEWSDFAVADDEGLSNVHFTLHSGAETCQISDLHSEYGTFVNGRRVLSGDLRDGDVIRAGFTRFRVEFNRSLSRETAF